MTKRLVIAQAMAGATLAFVIVIIVTGPDVIVRSFVQGFGTTADTAGQIGSVVILGLSAAAFIVSLKRRSFLVAGLLIAGGVISVTYAVTVISTMTSGHSPIHLVWDALAVLGLGVAKGIETRRIAAKMYEKNI